LSECSGCEHGSDQGSDQFFHEILTEIEVINQVTRSMSQQGKRILNISVDTQIEKIESSHPYLRTMADAPESDDSALSYDDDQSQMRPHHYD
jgi:hypothetical protein